MDVAPDLYNDSQPRKLHGNICFPLHDNVHRDPSRPLPWSHQCAVTLITAKRLSTTSLRRPFPLLLVAPSDLRPSSGSCCYFLPSASPSTVILLEYPGAHFVFSSHRRRPKPRSFSVVTSHRTDLHCCHSRSLYLYRWCLYS